MKALLDNRIELDILCDKNGKNIIFCRPIPESLDNVGIFVTNGKEFIYKYEYADNKKVLVADVFLENEQKFTKVPFEIVFTEQAELPKCTFNPVKSKKTFFITENEKSAFKIKPKEPTIKPLQALVKKEAVTPTPVKKPDLSVYKSETEIAQEALKKQNQLKEQENKILKEKQELEKQKTIVEKQNFINDKLSEYKVELLQEYYKAAAKQEQALSAKIQNNINELELDLKDRILNAFNDYNIEFKKQDTFNQEQQYNKLLLKINESIVQNRKELDKFVSEKISLENNNNKKEIEKIAKLLDKNYNDKILVEIVEAAKKSKKEINESVKNIVSIESVEKIDKLAKALEKNYNDKLLVELEKHKVNLFKEFKNISEVEIKKVISESTSKILEKIEKSVKNVTTESVKFDKNIKFSVDQQKYINDTAQRWARRILELGGGGGSVALQLANGGTINGTLNVTNGSILSGGVDLANIFVGDPDVNTVVHSSSAKWNSSYTTVNAFSGVWSTGLQTLAFNNLNADLSISAGNTVNLGSLKSDLTELAANSGSWNSVYTTTNANSGNWEVAYNQVGVLATQVSFLSSQIDKNAYENIDTAYDTIGQFAINSHPSVNKGYTVTLTANGRVYIFAGNNDADPNHYLEVNANPHLPIYVESINNQGTLIIDAFNLADFKSAKYTLQIETNFNNEIYFSELNVVGAVSPVQSVVSEYGQIATSNLITSYDTYIAGGFVYLTATFTTTLTNPAQNYVVKGLRTNFYKI